MNTLIDTTETKAFKVFCYKEKEIVAEYLFALLKEAMKFEISMRDKGYTTEIKRINLGIK